MIAFTPKTRPVMKKALSWKDYEREADENEYPPPARSALAVDEQLTRRGGLKEAPLKAGAERQRVATLEPVKLVPLPTKVAANPLLWSKEIRIEWAPQTGYQPKTYTPHSPLKELDLLVYAYENKDPDARKYMTDADYQRVCSWIEARESSEVIDPVATQEEQSPVPQPPDPAVSAVTQSLEAKEKGDPETRQEDGFMGAWG